MNLTEYLSHLEAASDPTVLETRRTGTKDRCSVCGERVQVVEVKVPMLTSSGTGATWRKRPTFAHSEACLAHVREKAEQRPAFDLWAREEAR